MRLLNELDKVDDENPQGFIRVDLEVKGEKKILLIGSARFFPERLVLFFK